jgi:copper chaperone CopZ
MDNMQHDTSMNMNHDNMDMNHDNMDMNHDNMDMNHDNMDMNKDSKSEKDEEITHSHIIVPTAQCDKCKKNLEEALNKVLGLKSFEVDIDLHKVHIYYDKKVTTISKIEDAITAAGYDTKNKKADPEAYSKLDDCCKLPQDRKKNKSN